MSRTVIFVLSAVFIFSKPLLAQAPPAPIVSPIFVGARAITGSASHGPEVTVTVTIAGVSAPAQVDPATGAFTFLVPPTVQLGVGSTVSVKQTVNGADSEPVSVTVTEALYDWGRVRAYFSTGLMISKEREDFSKNDVYLGFQVDKNWIQGKNKRWYFNSFFDTILAAVPIQPGAGDNSGSQEDHPDSLDQFLASRKAAVLRIGLYVPIVVEVWKFDGADHGLFIGPLAKAGIETITNSQAQVESAGATQILELDDLYNFQAFGFRFGHMKLNSDENTSPELISYLDMTLGRFESFELCRMGGDRASSELVSCLDRSVPALQQYRVRPWRYAFEGRLKVPGSSVPLYVGFNANAGQGRDDLRFVFGTMFDIGNLYRKLRPSIP